MAILVTGGAGYIGSHMAWHLIDQGEEVVVLDDLSRGERSLVPPAARFVHGSAGDGRLLADLFARHDIEAVIHFAGYIIVPESLERPMLYFQRNTSASAGLIEACTAQGVDKFIFSSTAAVYGVPETVPIPETAPKDPISPYGRSKLMTETMLADAEAAHGMRFVALRYFNVAGADAQGRTGQVSHTPTHLLKIASMTALGVRSTLNIHGEDYPTADGTCIRDYVHVTDLVSAHYAVLGHLREGGASAAYNCGYGRGVSVREMIAAFGEVMGRPLPYGVGPRRVGDPPILVADPTKLKTELGWRPRFDDLGVMIESALAWERSLCGSLPAAQVA